MGENCYNVMYVSINVIILKLRDQIDSNDFSFSDCLENGGWRYLRLRKLFSQVNEGFVLRCNCDFLLRLSTTKLTYIRKMVIFQKEDDFLRNDKNGPNFASHNLSSPLEQKQLSSSAKDDFQGHIFS